MIDKEITKYDIAYRDVLCMGVKWRYPENNIFYFTKDGKNYEFTQTEDVHFIADTDHIRCVIKDQFLPWWKDQRIKELEEENEKLKDRLNNLRCVYSYDGEVMEYCVNGPCPNDRSVSEVREENAALRERLEKSVERLKAREQSVCFGREWKAVVTDEDIDEVFGIAEARLAELKGETK